MRRVILGAIGTSIVGVTIAAVNLLSGCSTPPVIEWYYANTITRNGVLESVEPCYTTVRFLDGNAIRFLFPQADELVHDPVGSPVTIYYEVTTQTVGYLKTPGNDATPTPTPSATATATPTPSATPTATPTPKPTATPTPGCCPRGARPGACRCCNGFLGNSGKCA